MANTDSASRMWKGYEEDQMVYWLHNICTNWKPQGTVAVMKIVTTYHDVIHDSPLVLTKFTKADIVRKIMDLKEEYEDFVWYSSNHGVQLIGNNTTITNPIDFFIAIGVDESAGPDRYKVKCIKNFTKLHTLFHGGCFSNVDYKWLMNAVLGAEPAWLGKPFV